MADWGWLQELIAAYQGLRDQWGLAVDIFCVVFATGLLDLITPDANGHLRVHPKRLEHLDQRKSAQGDWRVKLLAN